MKEVWAMLKKFKGVICTLLVACALLCPVLSFAAPAYLPATAGSNTSDLVVITNPPSFSSTGNISGYLPS